MRSLNKARTSSASLYVKRLRLAVIAIARLTFATMAADSGVLPGIIRVRSSFGIGYFPSGAVERTLGAWRPRRDPPSIAIGIELSLHRRRLTCAIPPARFPLMRTQVLACLPARKCQSNSGLLGE